MGEQQTIGLLLNRLIGFRRRLELADPLHLVAGGCGEDGGIGQRGLGDALLANSAKARR